MIRKLLAPAFLVLALVGLHGWHSGNVQQCPLDTDLCHLERQDK